MKATDQQREQHVNEAEPRLGYFAQTFREQEGVSWCLERLKKSMAGRKQKALDIFQAVHLYFVALAVKHEKMSIPQRNAAVVNWAYIFSTVPFYAYLWSWNTHTSIALFCFAVSFDIHVSMPGFEPLPALLRLLRRLWPLLRQFLLITSLSLPPALAFTLRKLIGARR